MIPKIAQEDIFRAILMNREIGTINDGDFQHLVKAVLKVVDPKDQDDFTRTAIAKAMEISMEALSKINESKMELVGEGGGISIFVERGGE